MKLIYKMRWQILGLFFLCTLWNCAKENEEYIFEHHANLIVQMTAAASHTAGEYRGEIYEYDKDGVLKEGNFTQSDVEGGYGLILFPISKSLEDDVDLSNIYLKATLTFDETITPSLSGRHDITGDGIIITVTSGEGTTRQYRIRGYYE